MRNYSYLEIISLGILSSAKIKSKTHPFMLGEFSHNFSAGDGRSKSKDISNKFVFLKMVVDAGSKRLTQTVILTLTRPTVNVEVLRTKFYMV